jgi:acetoin utilization deacetylase AcuC-like enzyme
MKVGYVYDPIYLQHDTGYHVESASRLTSIMSYLDKTSCLNELTFVKPRAATVDEIASVHDRNYIAYIEYVSKKGGAWLEADTVISNGSYDAAIYAAGGAITAIDAVISGQLDRCFALVRPPGHHAVADRALGFCIFNNVAIAAKYAIFACKLDRIAIIDFDVHHGNGTQDAFYRDSHVLYVSTHQYPHYPGSGTVEEIGQDQGKGNIFNVPMPANCNDAEYITVYKELISPAVRRFRPQLIMVSAGYDIHWAEELAQMQTSTTGKIIRNVANETCGGKMVFTLEGGYNLEALSTSVKATFDILLDKNEIQDVLGPSKKRFSPPDIAGLVRKVKQTHGL